MPTFAQLNGGVSAIAVTDDDKLIGLDGATAKNFPATVLRTYMTAAVAADIAAVQGVNATQTTNIATNTAGLATLNSTVTNMALSTSATKTANYTFVLADGQVPFVTVVMNVATGNTLTIPPNSSVAFPIGTVLSAEQWGLGTTTWTQGAGVTINSRGGVKAMAGQFAATSARKTATNEWLLSGDLAIPSTPTSGTLTRILANVTPTTSGTAGSGSQFVDILAKFLATFPAPGAEIWVDPAGNDNNSGTSGSPKRTVQAAINALSPGMQIRVRAGTYNDGPFNWSGKNGGQANWSHLRLEPGAIMLLAGGGGGQGLSQLQNCSFIATYGGEWVGVNNVSNPYEVAHLAQGGAAHSWAVWGGTYHDSGGHAVASMSGSARFDICYNRMYRLCNWNEFQASAISCIGMSNVGTVWPDGYMNHIVGNVIDATWTDPSRVPPWDPGGVFIPSDGNGVIWDVSGGYTGRSLAAKNLIVGCGGRALHALSVDNVDMYLNTTLDNSQNLSGSWIGEISITDSNDCHAAWNLAAARSGSNRVGIFQNPGSSTWSDTVFLRGTGGSEANDPSVAAFNNVNKTAVGPNTYFVAYQQGVHAQVSITNIGGYRPKLAQVSKFTPSGALRTLMSGWPDPLGYLPPSSGDWAYGAFEAA